MTPRRPRELRLSGERATESRADGSRGNINTSEGARSLVCIFDAKGRTIATVDPMTRVRTDARTGATSSMTLRAPKRMGTIRGTGGAAWRAYPRSKVSEPEWEES
jgi:hypothetical protein